MFSCSQKQLCVGVYILIFLTFASQEITCCSDLWEQGGDSLLCRRLQDLFDPYASRRATELRITAPTVEFGVDDEQRSSINPVPRVLNINLHEFIVANWDAYRWMKTSLIRSEIVFHVPAPGNESQFYFAKDVVRWSAVAVPDFILFRAPATKNEDRVPQISSTKRIHENLGNVTNPKKMVSKGEFFFCLKRNLKGYLFFEQFLLVQPAR